MMFDAVPGGLDRNESGWAAIWRIDDGGGFDPGLQPDADLRVEKKKPACCGLRFNGLPMLVSLLQPMLSARCGALDALAICKVPPSV
jgi:hypothetical protein